MISTTTDSLSKDWSIHDEVIRLRLWATDTVYPLPADDRGRILVGIAPTCTVRVHDPSNLTSREHAALERVDGRWSIVDRSKNGLYLDDQQRERFLLTPGIEIGLGRHVTLIAESARTIALRAALARMLGWSAAHAELSPPVSEGTTFTGITGDQGPVVPPFEKWRAERRSDKSG